MNYLTIIGIVLEILGFLFVVLFNKNKKDDLDGIELNIFFSDVIMLKLKKMLLNLGFFLIFMGFIVLIVGNLI